MKKLKYRIKAQARISGHLAIEAQKVRAKMRPIVVHNTEDAIKKFKALRSQPVKPNYGKVLGTAIYY